METQESGNPRYILEGQIRECFGRVVYTHKTHEKCADILLFWHFWIKVTQIALSAISAGGAVTVFLGKDKLGASISVTVSTILLVLNAYTKNFNHGEEAQKHKQTALALWLIREQYLTLLVDLRMQQKTIEGLQNERDRLLSKLEEAYKIAPPTNSKAYKKAQKALQKHEDLTFSDQEIDCFVPKDLKRSTK